MRYETKLAINGISILALLVSLYVAERSLNYAETRATGNNNSRTIFTNSTLEKISSEISR